MIDASIQFNTSLWIICLSGIETPKFQREIEFNRVYFLPFCTKYVTWFSKYHTELIVALSSTNRCLIFSYLSLLLNIDYRPWLLWIHNIYFVQLFTTFYFYFPVSINPAHSFCPVCLSFCPLKSFNIGYNFWMVSHRAFIFYMHILWSKIFSLVLRLRLSVKINIKYQGHNFQRMAAVRTFVFHKHILLWVSLEGLFHLAIRLVGRRNWLYGSIVMLRFTQTSFVSAV